jgi:hypothetical protein
VYSVPGAACCSCVVPTLVCVWTAHRFMSTAGLYTDLGGGRAARRQPKRVRDEEDSGTDDASTEKKRSRARGTTPAALRDMPRC